MSYAEKYNALLNSISNHQTMVLATSLNDIVTTRMMSVIKIDGRFYFQTDKKMEKYNQIKHNCNVSLCFDNISIQGICKEIGVSADNKEFCKIYSKYFGSAYKQYSHIENEVLFEITPALIKTWFYENNKPYYEIYNNAEKSYSKNEYRY